MDLRTTIVIAVVLAAAVPGATGIAAAQDDVSCSFPFSAVDATGTEVTVEEDPDRIVTIAPSAAQTMWEIGARDEVVGVSKFSSYLEGAAEKENVSGGGQGYVVAEKVVALEPDLVLAPNVVENETVGQLRDAGLTVFRFGHADSVDFVVEKTRLTGELVGECEGAEETASWMEERLGTLRDAVEGEDRPQVIYPLGGGYIVGTNTFVDEMIETAGGRNVAAEANLTGYPQISGEVVVERDPEWLILNEGFEVSHLQDEAYNETTAVRDGQIVYIDPNYANQPAPQIVHVITDLARAFHPDAYAAANATATPTDTETDVGPTPPTPDTSPEPTETNGQPGFGIVAVVLALVATLLAARIR